MIVHIVSLNPDPSTLCRIRNNASLRESFVVEVGSTVKPRMAWYNPNDGMIPSGWLTEGLLADLAYYKPFATNVQTATR